MAKKADIISFKEAYSKVNSKKDKGKKNEKKVSNSQRKGATVKQKKKSDKNKTDETKNKQMLSKEEYIKKVMNDKNKNEKVENTEIKKDLTKKKKNTKKDEKAKGNKVEKNKKEKKEKNEKKENKKKFEIKKRFIALIVLIIVISLIIALIYFLRTSNKFKLTNVEIKPTKTYTIDEIWQRAEIVYGNNIFKYNVNKSKQNIEKLPYIKLAKVTRKLPGTITIEVTERQKEYVCLNSDTNEYIYVSIDGYILEKVTKDKLTLEDQIVSGIVFDEKLEMGKRLNDVELSKLICLQQIKEEFIKEKVDKKITSSNFKNGVTNILLDNKIEVIFPNADKLTYNVRFLKKILEEIDDVAGVIDMTKPSPSFMYNNI